MQPLLKSPEAAKMLGVSIELLSRWRTAGEGPAYIRLGRRSVRYERAEIDRWLRRRRVETSADHTCAGCGCSRSHDPECPEAA